MHVYGARRRLFPSDAAARHPFGITLLAPAGADAQLLQLAAAVRA